MLIKEVVNSAQKSTLCHQILIALPDWFGIPESIADYVENVKNKPFYAVYDGEVAVGFVSIKVHNQFCAEIYVMGILQTYHRKGLGREIVKTCEQFCQQQGIEFLTVKTLDEQHPDMFYQKTRLFYESMGFRPLEVFPLLWDESNPCLFLAKHASQFG